MIPFFIKLAKTANEPKTPSRSGDFRNVLPLLTYLEKTETYWEIDRYTQEFSQSVIKMDEENLGRVITEIEKFLQMKPTKPAAETQKYRCILKIIEMLQAWEDKRAVPLLERLVLNWNFHIDVLQRSLIALAKIDAAKGSMSLRREIGVPDENIRIMASKLEVTFIEKDNLFDNGHFNIYVNKKDAFLRWTDSCYSFKFEKGLVYFMYGGQENTKRFAGWAQSESEFEIIEQATNYLAWWLWSVNAIG